jgi:hypothetical protein
MMLFTVFLSLREHDYVMLHISYKFCFLTSIKNYNEGQKAGLNLLINKGKAALRNQSTKFIDILFIEMYIMKNCFPET